MALIADGGGGGPTLDPKAKHFERELFKVFSASTSTIWLTQEDWRGAKTQLEDLAKDVRQVRTELQAPGDGGAGWQGPAAEAALSSLEKLGRRSTGTPPRSATSTRASGRSTRRSATPRPAWYSDVASISTYVDPSDHMRLPAPYLPTPENTGKYSVPDADAAAAAEDAKWEQRNQAAKKVLDQLGTDTQTATGKMPIETKTKTETPYSSNGPARARTTRPAPRRRRAVAAATRSARPVGPGLQVHPTDPAGTPTSEEIPIPDPRSPRRSPSATRRARTRDRRSVDPISSDGDVTGTTGWHRHRRAATSAFPTAVAAAVVAALGGSPPAASARARPVWAACSAPAAAACSARAAAAWSPRRRTGSGQRRRWRGGTGSGGRPARSGGAPDVRPGRPRWRAGSRGAASASRQRGQGCDAARVATASPSSTARDGGCRPAPDRAPRVVPAVGGRQRSRLAARRPPVAAARRCGRCCRWPGLAQGRPGRGRRTSTSSPTRTRRPGTTAPRSPAPRSGSPSQPSSSTQPGGWPQPEVIRRIASTPPAATIPRGSDSATVMVSRASANRDIRVDR